MAEVVLEHVTKRYPSGVWAVRDLSLCFGDGDLVVLVGPSGCGKTTTLRLVAGLEEPTAGTIWIGRRQVNKMPCRDRDVAMVFQRPALYPYLPVRDNLGIGERLRRRSGKRTIAERVTRTAAMLGLGELLDRFPSQLSGGQQQRVALGRALVRQPEAFLLDEPLSNLDAPLRVDMRRELHLLQRRLRATMIYVTHDPAEALALGDRIVVLDRGTVQGTGTPQAMYDSPPNRFVAGFLGWPPMNFVDGALQPDGTGLKFEGRGWSLPVEISRLPPTGKQAGTRVTLGIRPDDILLTKPGGTGLTLKMEVALVESAGSATLVSLRRDGWQATARIEATAGREVVREGRTVDVMLNLDRGYWFDSETGQALAKGRSTA